MLGFPRKYIADILRNRFNFPRPTICLPHLKLAYIFLAMTALASGQPYFLNSYGDISDSGFRNVCLKAIDLENTLIRNNLILFNRGYIWRKTPYEFKIQNNPILLTLAESGEFAKNSDMNQNYVFYSISRFSNNSFSSMYVDSLADATIDLFQQFPIENGFRLRMKSSVDTTTILPAGLYRVNNSMHFSFIESINSLKQPGQLDSINGHDYLLELFNSGNRNLYYSFEGGHLTICRVNNPRTRIEDSLAIYDKGRIFAYHPGQDKIYRFNLNYEIHGKFPQYEKNYDDDRITPEVLIYDPVSFELLESHEIADYPPGNYPGPESGPADVAGDYIVYYFFEDDWMGKFAPAMLFIFDTRTNEASWLRVGWR